MPPELLEHESLSNVLCRVRNVRVLSGAGITPSLPDQSFSIVDPLKVTKLIRGRGQLQNRWRKHVPPDVLAQLDSEFPIVWDNTQLDLKDV